MIKRSLLFNFCFFLCFLTKIESQNINKYDNQKDLELKITKGLDLEQQIRAKLYPMMKSGKVDIELNNQMGKVDSINQIYVNRYLQLYGYPKLSEQGKKICDGVFYIIQHSNLETMEKYLPFLKKNAFRGEASKVHFAMMQDRVLMYKGEKQLYGTQASRRKNKKGYLTSKSYIWPIKNSKLVNSRRKKIGFKTTVEEYAKKLGAEYNPNEKLIVKK